MLYFLNKSFIYQHGRGVDAIRRGLDLHFFLASKHFFDTGNFL